MRSNAPMSMAIQNALLRFKTDGSGTDAAVATDPSMVVLIVDANSAPERSSLSSINQNVLGSWCHIHWSARKVIVSAFVRNIDQADFFVVRITKSVRPSLHSLVRIESSQPGLV